MENIFNKQFSKLLPVYLTVVALVILLSSSYALLRNSQTGTNTYTMNVGTLKISFVDQNTNALSISNMYPMSDQEGLSQDNVLEFTILNDGNLKANYNVYIEETSNSPVMASVMKYAYSVDNGLTYSESKVLGTDNYIERNGTLNVNETKSYKVKMWLDESANKTYMNQTFKARVVVEALQYQPTASEKVLARANSIPNCTRTVTDTDGTIYISGKSDNPSIYENATTDNCVIDFNYVWWSGKMWRITAIYPDGAIKMITDNNITSIAFNASGQVNYYVKPDPENEIAEAKSYMFQWLNEDFLDTLYNHGTDVIDYTKYWNATMPANTTISTKPAEAEATMIPTTTSPIGLLNSYEYYMAYLNASKSNNYLNIGYTWWLLNPYYSANPSKVWYTYSSDVHFANTVSMYGTRPSIYLKSGITLSGNGTKNSPYHLSHDYDSANVNDNLYTRYSGEYVKLKNNESEQLFRIVSVENNKTKIVAMDYADNKATKKFATSTGTANTLWGSGTTKGEDTWYTYLNNTYLPNLVRTYGDLFDSNLYYLGTSGYNYKLSICASETTNTTSTCTKTSQNGTFNIGLLRYGEMFASQQGDFSSSIYIWLMNRYDVSNVWYLYDTGSGYRRSTTELYGTRPSIHLKSTVKILSGSGTELDPYIVGTN